VLTYDFRLPPGPRTVEYALLAEELGFRAVWCPEIPAFGHDIWVTLARIAEKTKRIKFGPSVLIPSYRHPMVQASAIATLEQIAPGRLMVGFGTGFTGRAGTGAYPRRDMPEAVSLTGGPPRVRQRQRGLENDQQRDGLIAEAPASA
jgi:alkanesulfonate monooxygenase SsuD/methylene tetrahydromethanopterin reductase-like flavin-dependent oxidoreductase (luciferase family)